MTFGSPHPWLSAAPSCKEPWWPATADIVWWRHPTASAASATPGQKSHAVVGDHDDVASRPQGQGDEGTIEKVLERRNLFYRQDEIRTKSFAANIDQVLILIAAEPVFQRASWPVH